MSNQVTDEADFLVGPRAIEAYSRLSYTMWFALAEFIDNSTQSRLNYSSIVDEVLKEEGQPLIVEITHNVLARELTIKDNSIGMTKADLVAALHIAQPTQDSKGRSKYGMGMKTAACWIGETWEVVTCEWGSGEEWTAVVDVAAIAAGNKKIPLSMRAVGKDAHYTRITIRNLHRKIQKRTEETIRWYLGSMYRFDLADGRLQIVYNGTPVTPPEDLELDTDPSGKPMRLEIPPDFTINGKKVGGWVAVLKKGGRKFGGFSLFQERRQIQGFPSAWKPQSIFGGVDDEGANNLIAQRLFGLIELDGFKVSHTKDTILFESDEEEQLEKFLKGFTMDYANYAQKRRGQRGSPWTKEKIRDVLEDLKKEFGSGEMKDAVASTVLPPLETIQQNSKQQLAALQDSEHLTSIEVLPDLKVVVSLQERSEHDPHLTIVTGAEAGTIHVIINQLHPYYCALDSSDSISECLRQYTHDAVAEYRVSKLSARLSPDSVRRFKDGLLRADVWRAENQARGIQDGVDPS